MLVHNPTVASAMLGFGTAQQLALVAVAGPEVYICKALHWEQTFAAEMVHGGTCGLGPKP